MGWVVDLEPSDFARVAVNSYFNGLPEGEGSERDRQTRYRQELERVLSGLRQHQESLRRAAGKRAQTMLKKQTLRARNLRRIARRLAREILWAEKLLDQVRPKYRRRKA
jgi:hypothetical protein